MPERAAAIQDKILRQEKVVHCYPKQVRRNFRQYFTIYQFANLRRDATGGDGRGGGAAPREIFTRVLTARGRISQRPGPHVIMKRCLLGPVRRLTPSNHRWPTIPRASSIGPTVPVSVVHRPKLDNWAGKLPPAHYTQAITGSSTKTAFLHFLQAIHLICFKSNIRLISYLNLPYFNSVM